MSKQEVVVPLGVVKVRGKPCDIYPPTAENLVCLLLLRELATAAAESGDLFAALRPVHVSALRELVDDLVAEPSRTCEPPLHALIEAATDLLEHVPGLWAPYIAGTLTPALERLSTLAGQFAAASAAGAAPEA